MDDVREATFGEERPLVAYARELRGEAKKTYEIADRSKGMDQAFGTIASLQMMHLSDLALAIDQQIGGGNDA